MKTGNITITDDSQKFTVDVPPIVTITTNIQDGYNHLPITITADFTDIPPRLHQQFLGHLIYNYNREIVYNRSFIEEKEVTTTSWWQKIKNWL